MDYSKKLKKHIEAPTLYREMIVSPDYSYHSKRFGCDIDLLYEFSGERINFIGFYAPINSFARGVLNALLTLASGNPVGGLNRINAKELDFFIRDEANTPALPFYNDDFLNVFEITGSLYSYLISRKEDENIEVSDFFDLSFSEQIEFFEELLAKEAYPHPRFHKYKFDLMDTDKDCLLIQVNEFLSQTDREYLEMKIKAFFKGVNSVIFKD